MAQAKTTETSGRVTFSSQRNAVFRFLVSPTRIWLEHQTTKQQWECMVSSAGDFALKGAGIPHAIVMDYLAMSLGRLSEGDDATNSEVDLFEMAKNRMRLDFSLKFAVSSVVWTPEYQFVLQPMSVTETEVLAAKLKDAQEELQEMQKIVPAWVLKSDDPATPRKEATLQLVTLTGVKSWLFVCGFVKDVMGMSGDSIAGAVEWGGATLSKAALLIEEYLVVALNGVTIVGVVTYKVLKEGLANPVTPAAAKH